MKVTLSQPTSGYNLAAINANFVKLMDELNNKVLYRTNPDGEPNTMGNDLDMNGFKILNVSQLRVGGVNVDEINSALIWRGTWNSATSYAKSDAVYYNGTSYIAIAANTNSAPPSVNWNTLAAQGAAGAGTGDVVGPASATNNNIVAFNAGTGKLVKDSGIASANVLQTSNIGVTVQGYDAATTKNNLDQQFSKIQRSTPAAANTGTFDIGSSGTTQDFTCTPTGGITLTFSNIRAGVKGEILFVNSSAYTIAKAATVKAPSTFLSTISATGRYRLAYSSLDGTNVDITSSQALS